MKGLGIVSVLITIVSLLGMLLAGCLEQPEPAPTQPSAPPAQPTPSEEKKEPSPAPAPPPPELSPKPPSASDNDTRISAPALEWSHVFDAYGHGNSVRQTSDGGYIITGFYGISPKSLLLMKTDSNGNETWSRSFAERGSGHGNSVRQTTDGGYIIVGETGEPHQEYVPAPAASAGLITTEPINDRREDADIWLLKTNANGNKTWSQTFGDNRHDSGSSVCQTADGGYIIAGYTESYGAGGSDIWLIKTDAKGNVTWSQTFGGSGSEYSTELAQTADGGYIIVGRTDSYGAGKRDAWLIKTDANGNEIWNKTYGGSGYDYGQSVHHTSDGGHIIAGHTNSYETGDDAWLIKTDANGNEIWNKTYGGRDSDGGYSVCQTTDGGYIMTGFTNSSQCGGRCLWLLKVDANGNEIWNLASGVSSSSIGRSVRQTSDGGYIVTGRTSTRIWLLKYEADTVLTHVPKPAPTPPPSPKPAPKAPETVVFPDWYLESIIRTAIGKTEGAIYTSDLEELTSLSVTGANITNLSGLEYCVNLTDLTLVVNQIRDISPLSSLTNLTSLHLNVNQISDISPLSSLTNLTWLDLSRNRISDISPLSSLANLFTLELSNNKISDISPLSSLTGLSNLSLSSNPVSDISALSSFTNLTQLRLNYTNLDLSEGSEDLEYIRQLEKQGVNVKY